MTHFFSNQKIKSLNFIKSRLLFVIIMSMAFCLSCSNESITENQEETSENGDASLAFRVVKTVPVGVSANGDDGNVPANTLDGSLNTRWSSKGYNGKYITYDLGAVKSVSSVKLAWFKGNQRKAYFKIRVGTSTSNLTTVVDKKRSGSSGSTKNLETYNFDAVNVRYIRISCFGNSKSAWNSLTETEIYADNGNTDGGGDGNTGDSPGNVLGLTSNTWKLNGFTGNPGSNATYRDNVLATRG